MNKLFFVAALLCLPTVALGASASSTKVTSGKAEPLGTNPDWRVNGMLSIDSSPVTICAQLNISIMSGARITPADRNWIDHQYRAFLATMAACQASKPQSNAPNISSSVSGTAP